jgi:hypothetical protein
VQDTSKLWRVSVRNIGLILVHLPKGPGGVSARMPCCLAVLEGKLAVLEGKARVLSACRGGGGGGGAGGAPPPPPPRLCFSVYNSGEEVYNTESPLVFGAHPLPVPLLRAHSSCPSSHA